MGTGQAKLETEGATSVKAWVSISFGAIMEGDEPKVKDMGAARAIGQK